MTSTVFQMTIISYITKMHKNTQMTFREQDTNTTAVFTTDTKLPHPRNWTVLQIKKKILNTV
jgi:hypothetical protein